jgi:galactoside O-acetyltransferase
MAADEGGGREPGDVNRVIVLPGATIRAGSVVAAGSVVTRDVPAATLVAGVPAKVLRETPD